MAAKSTVDETILLKRIAQQDQTALAELYNCYARVLYAVAFKILGTVEEAEEVVLDVFEQVWRTAGRYDAAKARVDTWLFMQLRSRALDRMRAKERMSRVAANVDASQLQEERSLFTTPEEDLIIVERRTVVLTALGELPQEQRQVIELAYFRGLTHVQIAKEIGEPLGTIKTRIRLGITKLRSILSSWESG